MRVLLSVETAAPLLFSPLCRRGANHDAGGGVDVHGTRRATHWTSLAMAKAIDISLGSGAAHLAGAQAAAAPAATFKLARRAGHRPDPWVDPPAHAVVERLGVSRKGMLWDVVVFMPVAYRRGRETHPKPSSLGPSRWCLPIAVIGLIFIEDC
jgi:hypothetical protein